MTRRFYSLLFLVCMFLCKTWAADSYVLNQELTWDQVKNGTTAFALVSGTNVLYGSGAQNTGMAGISTATSSGKNACMWKVETTSGGYLFQCYDVTGSTKYVYWQGGYLNAQESQSGVSFILGNTNKTNGQDMNNGAVWTVTSTSGGYYIKNVGNNAYLNGTNTSATADKVWKFYSIKEYGREDFVFNGYDANPDYTLRPIRQKGKNFVYADDVNTKVTLHGVMDTPNAYFNNERWAISNWENRYNNDQDVANCLAYFEKTLSAYTNHQAGSYCDVFRLHLDPAWTNDPAKAATGSGKEDDISRFSADRLRTYMTKLYWPIAKKAIDKGMYVIMRPPGVCPAYIKVGDAYYNYLMTVWDIVSKDENVKKYAGMIMLELANEPRTVQDRDGVNSNNRASVLHDFFQPIVDKIRENGFKGIILSSGSDYQSQYGGYATKPITGDNIGYAVHWYPGWMSTNNTKATISDQTIINQFHTQVPVVDSRPIVVTEVDWSPEDASGEIDHYNEFSQPVYKNYGTWATGYTSSFGKNFKATHDYYGNISMTLTHPYEYVDFDQLFNNSKVTYSFQGKAEPQEACAYTCFVDWYPKLYTNHWIDGKEPSDIPTEEDLTKEMFHKWTTSGADATIDPEKVYPALVLNESTGLPYGDSNVYYLTYADLSQYGKLEVTASAGEPRFCFNRLVDNGTVTIEFPRDKDSKTYETVKDNGDGTKTYTIDLQAIVNEAGFVHLHCIKGANSGNVTVTSMRVLPVETITTPIDLAFTEEGSETFGPLHFQVEGDGVSINPLTGEVTATKAGGKIFVLFNNADLSAAKSITLSVNTASPYADICGTGEIFNEGTSINAWYGSKYNMQNLDQKASINSVVQDYNWNDKMGSVTKLQWNINAAGTMKINGVTITSGVPGTGNEPEAVDENYTASTYGRRPIDNKHPMWLVHVDVWNQADPQKIIDLIPEDIKPYVVMNLSLSCSYDNKNDIYQRPQSAIKTYKSWGSVCQQNGMWFTCQPASGGHTHIMDDDLETFEYFFKQYPNFLGWNYAEQFWGFNEAGDKSSTTEETRIALFAKLIPMHHKYGGFLTISFCGSENSHALNPVGMLKRNADLLKASEDYPDAILWLYKYTHPVAFYNNESVTFGPFVAGLSKNYGVRYDNCGYNDAVNYLYGEESGIKYPTAAGIGTVMEQMAQNGGAVWDGPELIWTEDFQNLDNSTVDGYTQRNWGTFPGFRNIWIDMFRKVIDGTIYIPTQKEVQEKTKIAIINDVTSGTIEDKYGTWGDLYDNIYKVDDPLNTSLGNHNGQMQNNLSYQKSSGRYGTIPMMPELYTTDAKAIPTKVNKSQRNSVWATLDAKKAAFDAAYPEVSTGDLFVSRYKNQLVTYNPYSNLGKTSTNERSASANVPLKYNTCQSMDLTWANYSSAIVKEHRDRIDFYLNNYRTDTTTTVVDRIVINGASSKPSYIMTKRVDAVATATETWIDNTYTLEINHMGPVDLTINCAGTAKGRSTNIVSDAALSTYNMPTQPAKFVGTIIKEAEDMNYKSIQSCVDNYWYSDKDLRGHAGNGIMKMGTNTNGGLTTNVKTNSTESYNVTVRYSNTDKAGNISLSVGGTTKQLAVEKTEVNEWKKATVAFSFTEGNNTFKLNNVNGINLWVDQVEFTPARIAAELYDVVLGTPENGTVTSDKAKATEGTKVTLTVTPASGFALEGWKCGFTKVTPVKNVDGTYSFTMPDNTVTITPLFKDVSIVYQLDIPSTVNSSLPEGWRTTEGTEVREYGQQYGSGPRIFTTFTGTYTHALYWRSLSAGYASADYGKLNDYPLNLKAGTYRLSYRMAAWKGSPQYKAQILNANESVLKTSDNITATSNANGSNTADLSATAELTLEFRVPEKGNYVINFTATGGELLLLDCRINALSIDPGQDDPEPEEFSFDDFKTEGGATFNRDTHEYTGPGKGGWTFDGGKDVSAYKYLVITSAQNRNHCKGSIKLFLDFAGREIHGETEGSNAFTEKGSGLWLDRWNHNNIIVINLTKLSEGGYDITKLNSVKFNLWNETSDKFYPSNVYLTNTLPDFTNGDFKNSIKVANKFGTICLPYAAACSGAKVYEVTGKKNGSLYMSRVDGLMEAGKAYFYCSTENYEGYQAEANYNVYFYKASDVTVDAPVINNGMVGTFVKMQPPKNSNAYILSSNQLYYVDSPVNVGANKAYIDMSQVPDLTPAAAAKSIKMSFFGGERAVTDVNDDGATNIDDVTEVISIICDPTEQNGFGDVNGDGRIDIDDVTYIINSICNNN